MLGKLIFEDVNISNDQTDKTQGARLHLWKRENRIGLPPPSSLSLMIALTHLWMNDILLYPSPCVF